MQVDKRGIRFTIQIMNTKRHRFVPGPAVILIVFGGLGAHAEEPRRELWFLQAQAAATVLQINDEGSPYRFSLGAGRRFTDHLDGMVDLVYTYYDVNAVRDRNPNVEVRSGTSSSAGFDLRLRHDLLKTGKIEWYISGLAGFQTMIDGPNFPADGSDENFTLGLGLGGRIPIAERMRFTATLQWFHISNARLWPNNSGYDGLQLAISPEWRF
jgi:hypothetical protein